MTAPEDDDDQARRRALDGELGATEPGGDQTADDGGQNTGDRGKPLAMEMPRQSGSAIRKTKNPETRSLVQDVSGWEGWEDMEG